MPIIRDANGKFKANGGRVRSKSNAPKVTTGACSPTNTLNPKNTYTQEITNVLMLVDKSSSMASYWGETEKYVYNTIETLKKEAVDKKQEIRFTLRFFNDTLGPVVFADKPISEVGKFVQSPFGNTMIWSSLDESIKDMTKISSVRDSYAKNVYLVMLVSDGENNRGSSTFLNADLARHENWTFTAACPPRKKLEYYSSGFDMENVTEWEGSKRGMDDLNVKTQSAVSSYMNMRSSGFTKSSTFYTDASNIGRSELSKLSVINTKAHEVKRESELRHFVEALTGQPYVLGSAYYKLDKKEKIQPQKKMILFDKNTGQFFTDSATCTVKSLLNLDSTGEIRVEPRNHSHFDIYVQSGSVNRILPRNTKVVVL